MVGRILKIITLITCLLELSTNSLLALDDQTKVKMTVSSSLYVSGDLVSLQLLSGGELDKVMSEGNLINLYLVASDGQSVSMQRFNTSEWQRGMAFELPKELETGNYKLVAHVPGSAFQTEAIIHVYNPTIFSSAIIPRNADPKVGIAKNLFQQSPLPVQIDTARKLIKLPPQLEDAGVLAVKIFDPTLEALPVIGVVKNSEITVDDQPEFRLDPISKDANSRISVFFLDLGVVKEFNMRDSAAIEAELIQQRGTSAVWAYQFDNMGAPIGEVSIVLNESKSLKFSAFDNTVPFSDEVVNMLDLKRKRKYINQIYRINSDGYESLYNDLTQAVPDQIYLSTNFEGIATLREAFSSVISKASVKRSKDGYEILLASVNSGFKYETGPLILVNGWPMFEIGDLIETPFHQIESVSIYNSINSQKQFGVLGRHGVVSFKIKEEFLDKINLDQKAFPIYEGVSRLVLSENRIAEEYPDLRSVLLWNPFLFLVESQNKTLSWNPNDTMGKYVMWIDFVNKEGISKQWIQPLQ
tara:strand:- start:45440 stop:47020 length:1581 start_codon:yes stop_codon:yes gene_type:complete